MSGRTVNGALGSWRLISTAVLIATAAVVLVSGFLSADSLELYGVDFRVGYYAGASSVVEGTSLYVPLDEVTLVPPYEYTYPPLTAVALVPFTLLPEDVAAVIAIVLSVAAVLGALALVGLRDVRCYAAVLASAPFWNILETANLTAALALGVAIVWRYREKAWPVAAALGVALAAKFLLWPLLAWLAATRRYRAAALSLAVGLVASILAWAVVGFQGLARFPAFLERLDEVWAENSYSIVGMATAMGLDPAIGRLLTIGVGGALLVFCVGFGRSGDDRRSFTGGLAASLALAPIVWVHYVVVLLVPLAIARPRFSAVWLLPLVLWVSPRTYNGDGLDPFVPAVVIAVMLAVMLVRPQPRMTLAEAPA